MWLFFVELFTEGRKGERPVSNPGTTAKMAAFAGRWRPKSVKLWSETTRVAAQ